MNVPGINSHHKQVPFAYQLAEPWGKALGFGLGLPLPMVSVATAVWLLTESDLWTMAALLYYLATVFLLGWLALNHPYHPSSPRVFTGVIQLVVMRFFITFAICFVAPLVVAIVIAESVWSVATGKNHSPLSRLWGFKNDAK